MHNSQKLKTIQESTNRRKYKQKHFHVKECHTEIKRNKLLIRTSINFKKQKKTKSKKPPKILNSTFCMILSV